MSPNAAPESATLNNLCPFDPGMEETGEKMAMRLVLSLRASEDVCSIGVICPRGFLRTKTFV
jgi:hypothetical protein